MIEQKGGDVDSIIEITDRYPEDGLRNFLGKMRQVDTEKRKCRGIWFVATQPPSHDFNKEIAEPGEIEALPSGAVGVRVDDNFWCVALLPYRFGRLDISTIVKILWPEIRNPILKTDKRAGEDA
jgi:hypothetical protein